MQTVYDWVTIAIFAGLIVIFLQRSVGLAEDQEGDNVWLYLPPAVALAVANYLGNEGYGAFAWLTIVGAVAYIVLVIKPVQLKR
jgi:hypothetical protein